MSQHARRIDHTRMLHALPMIHTTLVHRSAARCTVLQQSITRKSADRKKNTKTNRQKSISRQRNAIKARRLHTDRTNTLSALIACAVSPVKASLYMPAAELEVDPNGPHLCLNLRMDPQFGSSIDSLSRTAVRRIGLPNASA